jgi:hypothetical protein
MDIGLDGLCVVPLFQTRTDDSTVISIEGRSDPAHETRY